MPETPAAGTPPLPIDESLAAGPLPVRTVEHITDGYDRELLEKEVTAEGGYADQLYPPPIKTGDQERDQRAATQREEEKEEELPGIIQREQQLFDKVYTRGMEMAKGHTGPVVLLWDVDQTICEMNANNERVIRPAFRRAVNKLREELGDQFRIGLLTTVDARWVYEHCFEGIDPAAIADEFVVDVRAYVKSTRPDADVDEARAGLVNSNLERLAGILHPALYQAIADGTLDMEVADSEGKLDILSELHALHPEVRLGLVDDRLYSGLLDPANEYIQGIHVGPEIQDPLGRLLYERQRATFEETLKEAREKKGADLSVGQFSL